MPDVVPAAALWTFDLDGLEEPLEFGVPGDIQWSGNPIGRVALHPCTGQRTLLLRGDGTVAPPDIPVTLRIPLPLADQLAIRDALLAAWAAGTTGVVTPPMTTLIPAYLAALDPAQRPQERQSRAVLYISTTLLAMGEAP